MPKNLPAVEERSDTCKSELIAALDSSGDANCYLTKIGDAAKRYALSVQPLLALGADLVPGSSSGAFDDTLQKLECAYHDWKAIGSAFEDTLHMAYHKAVPRGYLLADQIYADLREEIGDPLAETYTRIRASWLAYVCDRPWDTFRNAGRPHLDTGEFNDSLNALVRGDELDIEDALNNLTGRLRHSFLDFLKSQSDDFADFEVGIWKRPEIIIAHDFWGTGRRSRLIGVLKQTGSRRFSTAFQRLESLYLSSPRSASTLSPQAVLGDLRDVPAEHRSRYYRCLMLHPDYEMRRYAVNNSDSNNIWKVLTPRAVPCATILSLLEKLVGSVQYTTTQRKVFFDAVYRRLLAVTTRSDVLYARGIVRILTKLNFFLEDDYFAKIMSLLDYLEAKERMYKIQDTFMKSYVDNLKREKDKIGNLESQLPDFSDIPLVILRKLARDGHFWYLLSMHPIIKVAKETIAHINTPDRALRIAGNHRVNQEVIRVIGKRRSLFASFGSKLALLSNPRTPPGVSLEYLPDLGKKDLEQLLRRSGFHPELRTMLRNKYNQQKT